MVIWKWSIFWRGTITLLLILQPLITILTTHSWEVLWSLNYLYFQVNRWRLSFVNEVDFLSTRSMCPVRVNWTPLLHFLSQGNHDPARPEFLDPLSDTEYLPLLPRTWGNTFNPSWSKHLIKGNKLSNFVFSSPGSHRSRRRAERVSGGGEWAHGGCCF